MIIKYKFATGEVTEVEVSGEIGAVITASRRDEHALEERNRYHCYSLDAILYEGREYGECDEYAVEEDSAEQAERVREAFSHLTEVQQRRLRLYADVKTLREIAALENASFQSVSESIEGARKKFLNSTASDEMVLTVHRWFANKSCPGSWMYARMGDLAAKVTAQLGGTVNQDPRPSAPPAAGYPETLTSGYYRVRKAWNDVQSQIGAYRVLSNAKAQADTNPGYHVFSDNGVSIYPTVAAYREYTVQKGDSLWVIAQRLLGSGTRYKELKALNGLTGDTIYSGQKLKIPN